jgi:dethiobiotin synthetase
MNIFITGTDTNIGKTVVTAGIAALMQSLGYTVGVYKPVQTGATVEGGVLRSPDIDFVKSIDKNIKTFVGYCLEEPAAPYLAASLEKIKINKNKFKNDYELMSKRCDILLMEGAGGILVPITHDFTMRDLAKFLNLPVIIVAGPYLGTINHTLLTIEAVKKVNLELIGVIISGYPENTHDISLKTAPDIISKFSHVEILGILPEIKEIKLNYHDKSEALIDAVLNNLDLEKIFKMKIPKLSS